MTSLAKSGSCPLRVFPRKHLFYTRIHHLPILAMLEAQISRRAIAQLGNASKCRHLSYSVNPPVLVRPSNGKTPQRPATQFKPPCRILATSTAHPLGGTEHHDNQRKKASSKSAVPSSSASKLDEIEQSFPRRSMLYVPGSSDKMIKKSQESEADCIIFDLEDSVATHRKGAARESVLHGLNAAPRPGPELAVRINPPSGSIQLANDDLDIILPSRQLNVSEYDFEQELKCFIV